MKSDQPGYFELSEYYPGSLPNPKPVYALHYICPCGCGDPGYLPLMTEPSVRVVSPCWLWDGNRDRPTLSPSILRTAGCKSHGFLQAGVWSSAGDGPPVHPNCYKGGSTQPENLMPEAAADQTAAIAPASSAPGADPHPEAPQVDHAPPGFLASLVLHFFDGILHQLHSSGHPGESKHVWVPIGGQTAPERDINLTQSLREFKPFFEPPEVSRTSDPPLHWPDVPAVAQHFELPVERVRVVDYGRMLVDSDSGTTLAARDTDPSGRVYWRPPIDQYQWKPQDPPFANTAFDPAAPIPPAGQESQPQGAVVSDRPPQVQE